MGLQDLCLDFTAVRYSSYGLNNTGTPSLYSRTEIEYNVVILVIHYLLCIYSSCLPLEKSIVPNYLNLDSKARPYVVAIVRVSVCEM